MIINKEGMWKCTNCKYQLNATEVKKLGNLLEEGRRKILRMGSNWENGIQLIQDLNSALWKNHVILAEIKQVMITCMGIGRKGSTASELDIQKIKLNWCLELLDLLNIIEPGCSLGRGISIMEFKDI